MHEYSVVSSLIILCEEEALKHSANKVIKIIIEVGERSGVEVELLKSAFDVFKMESDFCKTSILEVINKQIKLFCENCSFEFYALNLEYGICPNCQSNKVKIHEGRELNLLSLELE